MKYWAAVLIFVSVIFASLPATAQTSIFNPGLSSERPVDRPSFAEGLPDFDTPLLLTRGQFLPTDPITKYLSPDLACGMASIALGDLNCAETDGIEVNMFLSEEDDNAPDHGVIQIIKPNSQGRVSFDDWELGNAGAQQRLANAVNQSVKSDTNGYAKFESWIIPPTLDRNRGIVYFVAQLAEPRAYQYVNRLLVFDRTGYVEIRVDLGLAKRSEYKRSFLRIADRYVPNDGEAYADAEPEDRISEMGVTDVLYDVLEAKQGNPLTIWLLLAAGVVLAGLGGWFLKRRI